MFESPECLDVDCTEKRNNGSLESGWMLPAQQEGIHVRKSRVSGCCLHGGNEKSMRKTGECLDVACTEKRNRWTKV